MQVEDLKIDIQAQNQKQGALEARAINAERKVEELHLKLENVSALYYENFPNISAR